MTDTRRLSAEMRQAIKDRPIKNTELRDALDDLDMADRERDEWRGKYEAAAQAKLDQQHKDAVDVVADVIRERDAAQATIAQQGAVIAAMRDKFVKIVTDGHPECGCYYHAAQASADLNTAQLAADHDAAIRGPLEKRIQELEEALNARTR